MNAGWTGRRFAALAGLFLLGLAACQTTPPPPPAAPVPESAPPPVSAEARRLTVVAEESMLQILVYRGGPMARLGHNHVIASRHLEGEVFATDEPTQTRFDIRIPVNELTVDEPAMREEAGADFPAGVPQSARDGTRRNLLSDGLLDAANYPTIRLRALEVRSSGEFFDVTVEITLKGQVRTVRVPVQLASEAGSLRARGEFLLRQSELGLKPFSVAMGTLVVLDEMKIRFDVTAR
jgi:polyisoprenoid-binding protein YceI